MLFAHNHQDKSCCRAWGVDDRRRDAGQGDFGFVKRKTDMDPFLLLGILAIVIGLIGAIVLIKGRKKNIR